MRKGAAKTAVVLIVLVSLFALFGVEASAEEPLVRFIVVKGNGIVDTNTIKAAIVKTKINQPVAQQKLLDDMHSIYDLGYFQDVKVNLEPALGGFEVVFEVVENPIVSEIDFSGLPQVPFQEYKKQMKTQTGYILNVYDLGEDLYALREWIATEHGYLTRIAVLEGDVDGRIYVELAPTAIKDIVIEGNEKTKDFVVERELTFEPGDLVNMHEIDQSLHKVLMLGFFDEISRDFSDEEDPDETILTISLKERKTGSATFGVAYSKEEGLLGFVEAADDNFFGRGQRVNATVQFGKKLQTYELGFYEPYILEGGTSLGANLYRRGEDGKDDDDNEYKLITIGGDLTLGHRIAEFTKARLTLRVDDNKYHYEEGITGLEDDYRNSTVGFGFNTNTSDHPFNPTEGFRNDAYVEVGVPWLGNENVYSKLRIDHSHYFGIGEKGSVFAVRGLGGRLLTGSLKKNEKFAIGGADTLRGYSLGDADEERGLRGDHMLVLNAEFRFPIVEKVVGVLFTDWGTTWNEGDTLSLKELKNSFGLGVRLDTPLGLLRLDYGFGKDKEEQRKGQFYFGIGQTF